MVKKPSYWFSGLVIICLLLVVLPTLAQEMITADDVNEIASKLYCPVCENIPLDTCGTAACDDWRNEIRIMLEEGMSEDEIIDDFVIRFGDRVVGVPQDSTLRSLSLITPWIVVVLMLAGMAFTLRNWQRNKIDVTKTATSSSTEDQIDDYMSMLERDVLE